MLTVIEVDDSIILHRYVWMHHKYFIAQSQILTALDDMHVAELSFLFLYVVT